MRSFRIVPAALIVAAVAVPFLPAVSHADLSEKEQKCTAAVSKSYAKLQSSILKILSRCHSDDISGKENSADACATLSASADEKVQKAKAKFVSSVAKACKSTCSISEDKECVSDLTCPPKHTATPPNNSIAERCLGKGGSAPFSIAALGWPGPYCTSILGHGLTRPEHLGECLSVLADRTVESLDSAVWDGLDETSGLDATSTKCASSIAKAVSSAASRSYLAVASCRNLQQASDTPAIEPYRCSTSDSETVDDVDAEIAKLRSAVAKSCVDADIAALAGLCSASGSSPTTVAGAQDCLEATVREIATEERGHNRHVAAAIGMLNVTHPGSAAPYCGDGIVSPGRDEQTGVGEECDVDADDACPGDCLPPGDIFQCTCATTPRERFIVDGTAGKTDSDAGWKGASHDATHLDNYGYVTELSNCDCAGFDQADCVGGSSDPVCDVHSNMAPRCSDAIDSPLTCDQRGNNNGVPTDSDCYVCDADSINAGTYCANGNNPNETVCQSQCFDDATDAPVVPQVACLSQADCGDGQTCRGRCDNSVTCDTMTEGAPLAQVSAAISVCITLEYVTDITGTKNIETGQTSLDYTTRNNIQLGNTFTVPCPVCGGACVGGSADGEACFGRCDSSGDACLTDAECTGPGDTACLESAAECPGGFCSLDLRCSGGPRDGGLCRPVAVTSLGVVSNDCPPDPSAILSGGGVMQPFENVTTGVVQHVPNAPCTDSQWGNYDCPCPADAPPIIGVPTKPAGCAAACNAGANEGLGCATGDGGTGVFTSCVGGTEPGAICDEDSDCGGGGTCTGNPKHCTAGVATAIGDACSSNGDCGLGGLCEDACPAGKCVPLCFQQGACVGGARDGDGCASPRDCAECTAGNPLLIGTPCVRHTQCDTAFGSGDGVCSTQPGVTCVVDDPEDGLCAAGPVKYRCTGDGFKTLPCELDTGTCTSNQCTSGDPTKLGSACTIAADCLVNNVPIHKGCEAGNDGVLGDGDDIPGAGLCEPRPEDCYFNNGWAEGGDTLNGQGSPSDVNLNAVFCTPPNGNPAIDTVSGFGGPSRTRRQGSAFVNVPSIP